VRLLLSGFFVDHIKEDSSVSHVGELGERLIHGAVSNEPILQLTFVEHARGEVSNLAVHSVLNRKHNLGVSVVLKSLKQTSRVPRIVSISGENSRWQLFRVSNQDNSLGVEAERYKTGRLNTLTSFINDQVVDLVPQKLHLLSSCHTESRKDNVSLSHELVFSVSLPLANKSSSLLRHFQLHFFSLFIQVFSLLRRRHLLKLFNIDFIPPLVKFMHVEVPVTVVHLHVSVLLVQILFLALGALYDLL